MPFRSEQWRLTRVGRWLIAGAGWTLTSLLLVGAYWLIIRPDLRLGVQTDTHQPSARREIALTFDDGPHPLWAPLLADTLERHGARGTFFLVGYEAQRFPELTARLVRGGHQLANHSLSHPYPNLTSLPPAQVRQEIEATNRILAQFTGQPVHRFRPPGGGVDNDVLSLMKEYHLRLAWWSENAGDWSTSSPEVTARRLDAALRPGLIVLMHQRESTVAALERFLAQPREHAYTVVTLDELMRLEP